MVFFVQNFSNIFRKLIQPSSVGLYCFILILMRSMVVFCKGALDVSYISKLSIDYLLKLNPGSRVQKIMFPVHFPDFGGCAS